MDFYNLLGDRFIAAGDYNATHTHWGSRLVTPKGRQLYNAIIKPNNKLDCFPWQPHILANRPQESSRPNRPSSDKHSPQYNKRQTAFGPVARPFASANNSSSKHKNYRSPPQYKKYVSSHIQLTPHFNIEADIDCSTDALEEVFVEAADISTQDRDVQTNHFKTNLPIERLVLEKRRLRRAWQTNRSLSSKQRLKEEACTLNRALKQETKKAQQRYIKKLSPTSTKYSCGGLTQIWAHQSKQSLFALHLRNVIQPNPATGSFVLPQIESESISYHHCFTQRRSRKSLGNWNQKGPWRWPNNPKNVNWTSKLCHWGYL